MYKKIIGMHDGSQIKNKNPMCETKKQNFIIKPGGKYSIFKY
jgi:hypothetical protein